MAWYLVIGSGLIGRLLSWRLISAGHQVDIASSDDKTGQDSAGLVAAAMIAPATEAVASESAVQTLGERSLSLWPQWLAELDEPVFYQAPGTLVIAHAGDQRELERFKKRTDHVLNASAYQHLARHDLAQLEPDLGEQFDQALWFENEAYLDNRQLFQVLGRWLTTRCDWQRCDPVETITASTLSELTARYFDKKPADYTAVIDCRGNGARQDLAPLRSVRGEIIRVSAPDVTIQHAVRLMHPRYPLYLAPRPNHEYVLGATVLESDDRSPVSVRSSLELLSALYSIHKGFAEARVLDLSTHCRPALPNHLPKLIKQDWGFQLNGFYRHGYLFGPAMVELCLHVLSGQTGSRLFEEYYEQ